MMTKRVSSLVAAVALSVPCIFGTVAPASAQSIWASHSAAASAGDPRAATAPMLSPSDTTPTDTTATYTAIFGQVQTTTVAIIAGVGALAFGVYLLGLGYGVAWRLTGKSVKSIAK